MTNTGSTVVDGDLGVSPGSAITGFPPGIVNGTIHAADAVALQAQSDVVIAYDALTSQACDFDLTGQDLGGLTLIPGVYCFSSSAQLTGALVLDAQGNPLAVWVFQIGSTLTTASNSSVGMINSGDPCNVFWQVGTSATLGTNTAFVGNILALTSITLTTGAQVNGRALARNGAVTMDTNHVSNVLCVSGPTPTPTPTATPTATPTNTPTPTPTNTPTATPTNTPIIVPVTSTPIIVPATNTPIIAPPTNTPGAAPTNTPGAAPTNTPGAAPTSTPGAAPTALAPSILPVTGGGPVLDSRQLLAGSLGLLGLGLVLSGFALRRKRGM